jgi:nitroreductase
MMNDIAKEQNGYVRDVIKQRRSIGQMSEEQPEREQIEQLLEAATYAPNHHLSEPWHFFVLTGAAREELGEVMAASLKARMAEPTSPKSQSQLLKERNKPLRAPVVITVAVKGVADQEEFLERVEATAAAVQNMLLTAQEMGLATMWRSGKAAYDPQVKRWFGLAPEDHIAAFLYVGFPKGARQERIPTHFSNKTTWLA